ncbi:hypothetical protein psyc5s11_17040 [Clostridium gelidum]|uniref:GIY-YIG domain-containing protein n=1 Tax=Clostridium gelidum TaxID=704125 RepID=A0ABN6ITW2_9CLOT|nr:hypothetical protein psyc5s11_17040 [Clostridium gelidum]
MGLTITEKTQHLNHLYVGTSSNIKKPIIHQRKVGYTESFKCSQILSLTGVKIPTIVECPLKSYAKCINDPKRKIIGMPIRIQSFGLIELVYI